MILRDMVEMGEAGAVLFDYNPLEDKLKVSWAPNGTSGLAWVTREYRPAEIDEPIHRLQDLPPELLMIANLTVIRMELVDGKFILIGLRTEPTLEFLLINRGPEPIAPTWKIVEFYNDPDTDEDGAFCECPECAAKSGSPLLCEDCLKRREAWSERQKR